MSYSFREGSDADVDAIVTVVNRAFAVENFFKSGERTDAAQIREMMSRGTFLLLSDNGALAGCVFAQPQPQPPMSSAVHSAGGRLPNRSANQNEISAPSGISQPPETKHGYIGLLSVNPDRQKSGLGRQLMSAAEAFCRRAGCFAVDIVLVNVRPELAIIYGKMGYTQTGTESAAVIRTAFQPVHFIRMSKKL